MKKKTFILSLHMALSPPRVQANDRRPNSQKEREPEYRNWCFTINNYTLVDYGGLENFAKSTHVKFMIFESEHD